MAHPTTIPVRDAQARCAVGVLLDQCRDVLSAAAGPDLTIELDLQADAALSAGMQRPVLRVLDELLSNAVSHGFYGRVRGCVSARVSVCGAGRVAVMVADDGWGFEAGPILDGNGFNLLRQMGVVDVVAPGGAPGMRTCVSVTLRCRRFSSWPLPATRPRVAAVQCEPAV